MKDLHWKPIFLGVLLAIGITVAGTFALTLLLWGLVGRSIGSIIEPGPLLIVMSFGIMAISYLFAGYVTSKKTRPHGLKNALMVALICILPGLAIYPPVDRQIQMILPFLFCAAGALLVRQR